jgi:hypothetical protein
MSARRNTTDVREHRFYERLEKRQQERFDAALLTILASVEGRIVLAHLVRRAGVYTSAFNGHGGIQSYNIGKQDAGRELMADITRVSIEKWQLLEREEAAHATHVQREIDATHTSSRVARPGDTDHDT